MNMRKTLTAGVIAAACAMTALISAAPAQAGVQDWDNCTSGRVCLYGDTYGRGRFLTFPGVARHVGKMNDLTSSIWNRSGRNVCFYQHANYGGKLLLEVGAGGSKGAWLNYVGDSVNDRISSYNFC
ncbi:hypothetical protein DP939_25795 [Spongiactinospora rosea]|uniref:Peptidase inhibitor family I36 n=1 Tax=Spongiactinospora rosea TaxID=2248750 RepID=A0A366LVG0_9ACTN|nr:peptidase inhibitor family I36 protein [Spongiactinospora rosea]RBQ17349.1 hypothetical protein DP939_25795 [Spongiactinospora rosea]